MKASGGAISRENGAQGSQQEGADVGERMCRLDL